jgi:hypothetical protein
MYIICETQFPKGFSRVGNVALWISTVLSFKVTLSRLHTEQEASQVSALLSNVNNTVAKTRLTMSQLRWWKSGWSRAEGNVQFLRSTSRKIYLARILPAECYSNINAVPTHSAVIQPQSFTSFRSPWCFELLWCIYLLKRKPQQAYSQHSSCSTSRVYFVYSKVTHNAGCCPSCFFLFTRTLTTDYIRALRHNLSPSCSICFQRIYVFKECNLKSHCNTKHAGNTVWQTAGRVKKCTLREFRKRLPLPHNLI